ncbi:MAG: hypothetical protein ABSF21_00800 [Dehalococcoidia bacterium]
MKKAGIIISVIAIIALVVCLVPLKEVAYAVTVDYEDTATYYENEPYNATEPYTETVPLDYEVVDTKERIDGDTTAVSVVVRNKDSIAGTFTVDFSVIYVCTFIAPGSIKATAMFASDQRELHLDPNDTETARYTADNPYPANCGFDSWSYTVTPSTKEVEAERTVTKYRQVEKQRTVTKQRQETRYKKVTMLDYLLHY